MHLAGRGRRLSRDCGGPPVSAYGSQTAPRPAGHARAGAPVALLYTWAHFFIASALAAFLGGVLVNRGHAAYRPQWQRSVRDKVQASNSQRPAAEPGR